MGGVADQLHYVDYAVAAMIVLAAIWLFVRWRRRPQGPSGVRRAGRRRSRAEPRLIETVALGLLQGPAELLPVSSSAHVGPFRGRFAGGTRRSRRRRARRSRWRCISAPR